LALYTYRCVACEYTFELRRAMSDDTLPECPECGKSVEKVFGKRASFILNGAGFYVNDYKKENSTDSVKKGS
jgi:putative FmdB family regulatory protein